MKLHNSNASLAVYDPKKHLKEVQKWLKQYGEDTTGEYLSPYGVVLEGKGALFLYKSEGVPVGSYECMVVNKEIKDKTERIEVMQELALGVMDLARQLGIKQLQITTPFESIAQMSVDAGCDLKRQMVYQLTQEL